MRTSAISVTTRKGPSPFPALDWLRGEELSDGGGRAALAAARRSRPDPPHLHARARPRRRRREGNPKDEVALRRPARAAVARHAPAPPGEQRAADGHRRRPAPV